MFRYFHVLSFSFFDIVKIFPNGTYLHLKIQKVKKKFDYNLHQFSAYQYININKYYLAGHSHGSLAKVIMVIFTVHFIQDDFYSCNFSRVKYCFIFICIIYFIVIKCDNFVLVLTKSSYPVIVLISQSIYKRDRIMLTRFVFRPFINKQNKINDIMVLYFEAI